MNFREDRVAPDKPVTPARFPLTNLQGNVRAGDDNGREKIIS
ncbi:MAG: hypothetical protein A4E59_02882 [Syntrophorhabdus sp. PtaB.Bin027]|nr:MAG: hypothetical protein A4E59_02882 [Syntrophorhabdus sp. PtaB.Bin027]